METTNKNGLLRFLTMGLLAHSQQETEVQLGNRSEYIGMSDIGKAMECLRSAVADKVGRKKTLEPHEIVALPDEDIEKVLIKQLTLQRGHWQEYGLEKALIALQSHYIPQLEICIDHLGTPIKAHLDITLVQGEPQQVVRVLELKSNEHIPEHLYTAYEAQIYGQVGLLYEYWNTPCFNVPATGELSAIKDATFPEVARHLFGISLADDPQKVDIEGWVLSISMSAAKPFGPYKHDRSILDACLRKAQQIWQRKQDIVAGNTSLDDCEYSKGFYPLCDYCSVNDDCPKFSQASVMKDSLCDGAFHELEAIKGLEKQIKAKKKDIEQRIKKIYALMKVDGRWLQTSDYRFKVTQMPGRKSISPDKLAEHYGGEIDTILSKIQSVSKPYDRLFVSRINSELTENREEETRKNPMYK